MKAPDGWEFVPGQGEKAFTRPHGVIEIRRLSFWMRLKMRVRRLAAPQPPEGGPSPKQRAVWR